VDKGKGYMPYFRCFVRGEDYPGQIIGLSDRVGFFVTRFVEAVDKLRAEQLVVEELEKNLKILLERMETGLGSARLYVEEVSEASSEEASNATGFTWYPMTPLEGTF
jgi:hypothetical protein